MHVKKQFTTPVLIYNIERSVERVDQMPMPVMEVDANVFAEITNPVLRVQVVGRIIVRYFDWSLLQKHIDIYNIFIVN